MADFVQPVIHSRAWWTKGHRAPDASPATRQRLTRGARMYVHHTVTENASQIVTNRQQIEVMRDFWEHHVEGNGWSDIGYGFVVFPPHGSLRRARILEGRGFDRVPASQAGCNSGNWSVSVVGNFEHDRVDHATLDALRYLHDLARKKGYGATVVGHLDCRHDTACPGRNLYKLIHKIDD